MVQRRSLGWFSDVVSGHLRTLYKAILFALDLTAAFDTVDHSYLVERILLNPAPNSIKHGMINYLQDIQARVNFRGKSSKPRKIRAGIVQAGVLSDFPVPPEGIKVIIYADDVTICTSGPNPDDLVDRLNSYNETVCSYFQSLDLTIDR